MVLDSGAPVPRALALFGDETGCNLWRVIGPFRELQRRGYVADYAPLDGCPKCGQPRAEEYRQSNEPSQCFRCGHTSRASDVLDMLMPYVAAGRYNVLVTPRIAWPEEGIGDNWIATIHKAGLAWVYEIDDDVFSPSLIDRQMRLFEKERAKGHEQLDWERRERIRLLKKADAVTVSTRRLATVVRAHVGEGVPVYHVPNAIDVEDFRASIKCSAHPTPNSCTCLRVPELQDRLVIGWSGGTRDDLDILPLAEAWSVVAQRFPQVMFAVQGHIPQVLADCVPKERRYTLPWVDIANYQKAFVNYDIGCCSVGPTVFNTSKSCIKWYEMTLGGAACVVSDTVYGREANQHGYDDALVAHTVEDWVAHLSLLVEDADARETIWRNAKRTVVTHHSLANNWWRWLDAWADAVDRFESKPRLLLPAGAA